MFSLLGTVPGFFMALALVAATDLVAAVPRSFALAHGSQGGVVVTEAPLSLPRFEIRTAPSSWWAAGLREWIRTGKRVG